MTIQEYINSNRRFRNFHRYNTFERNHLIYIRNIIEEVNTTRFIDGEAEFEKKLDKIVEDELEIARANGEEWMTNIIPTIDHTQRIRCGSIWDLLFLMEEARGLVTLDLLNFKTNKLSWWTRNLENPTDRQSFDDNSLHGLRDWSTLKSLIFFNSDCYDNELDDFKPEMWTNTTLEAEVRDWMYPTEAQKKKMEYKYLCKGCEKFTDLFHVQSFGVFGKNKNMLDKHDCFYLCDLCTKSCMVPCKHCNTALGIPLDESVGDLSSETIYHYNPDAQLRFRRTKRARH